MTLLAAVSCAARKRKARPSAFAWRSAKRFCSESSGSESEGDEAGGATPASAGSSPASSPEQEAEAKHEEQTAFVRLGEAIECVAMARLGHDAAAAPEDRDLLRDFRAVCLPAFSFGAYVSRLAHYLTVWKSRQDGNTNEQGADRDVAMRSLLIGLVYVDRMLAMHPDARICPYTLHRLLLVATLLACKFTEDRPVSNRFWAQVAGVPLPELNLLEERMCGLLAFKLFVREDEYARLQASLTC